jgi:hypothetical protein
LAPSAFCPPGYCGSRNEPHRGKCTACAWLDRPVPARQSSPATATSKKAWAWMALTGRRPAEIFFSASFSLPPKKTPIPPSSRRPAQNPSKLPVPAPWPYLIPVLADPKKLVQALDPLRDLKSFPSSPAVNTTTGRSSPSTFPQPSASWTYPTLETRASVELPEHLQTKQRFRIPTRKRLFGLSRTCSWPAVEPLPAANESVDSIIAANNSKNLYCAEKANMFRY